MKTEPDPSSRSGTSAANANNNNSQASSQGGKPLLYSKALSSSLPAQAVPPAQSSQQSPHDQADDSPTSPVAPAAQPQQQPPATSHHGGRKSANGNLQTSHQHQQHHQGYHQGGHHQGGHHQGGNGNGNYGHHQQHHQHHQHQNSHQNPQQHHNNYNNGGHNSYNGRNHNNNNDRQQNHHQQNQHQQNQHQGGHQQGGGGRDYEISTTNLYICGLKPETRDEDLKILCSPYGAISTTKAIMDRATNSCRGFGFVDFEEPYSAHMAMDSLKHQGVQAQMARCPDGKRQKVNVVNTPSEHDPTNLYIANLPAQMSEKDLETMLSAYGTVTSTRVLKDDHGVSRCVGFARMETRDMCDHIIRIFKDKVLPGSSEVLTVKYADGGAKRKVYKNNGARYQNDDQRSLNDNGSMATNGVSQMLPNQLNGSAASAAAAGFPNMTAAAYGQPFMGMGMGMHHPGAVGGPGSQYPTAGPGGPGGPHAAQLYGPQQAALAAAQMAAAYGQPMGADPSAMQMHLNHLMSQMSINNTYPQFNPYMYGMAPAQPQVAANVETDPNVQTTLDGQTQGVVSGAEGQSVGQAGPEQGFVQGAGGQVPPQQPGQHTAALAAAMIYAQAQN